MSTETEHVIPHEYGVGETDAEKVEKALMSLRDGAFDGEHHKQWAIDQTVRILTGCPLVVVHATDVRGTPYSYETYGESEAYKAWVREMEGDPEDDDNYYGEWDTGIAP